MSDNSLYRMILPRPTLRPFHGRPVGVDQWNDGCLYSVRRGATVAPLGLQGTMQREARDNAGDHHPKSVRAESPSLT